MQVIKRYQLCALFHRRTRREPGFCVVVFFLCYRNSPFYEKVELPEPFTDFERPVSLIAIQTIGSVPLSRPAGALRNSSGKKRDPGN